MQGAAESTRQSGNDHKAKESDAARRPSSSNLSTEPPSDYSHIIRRVSNYKIDGPHKGGASNARSGGTLATVSSRTGRGASLPATKASEVLAARSARQVAMGTGRGAKAPSEASRLNDMPKLGGAARKLPSKASSSSPVRMKAGTRISATSLPAGHRRAPGQGQDPAVQAGDLLPKSEANEAGGHEDEVAAVPAVPDEVALLEEENRKLKERIKALEALHNDMADDPEKYALWWARELRMRNVHLERQLHMAAAALGATGQLKAALRTVLQDFRTKIGELKASEPISAPKQSPSENPPRRISGLSPGAATGGSSRGVSSANGRPSLRGPAKAASPSRAAAKAPASRAPSASPSSQATSGTAAAGSLRKAATPRRPSASPEARNATPPAAGQAPVAPAPPSTPRVAVTLEWLEAVEKWTAGALGQLEQAAQTVQPSEREGLGGAAANPFVVRQVAAGLEMGVPSEAADHHAGGILRPPGGNGEVANLHALEEQLVELHPRLLRMSNLLRHMVMPALSTETVSELHADFDGTLRDLFAAVRSLGRQLSPAAPPGQARSRLLEPLEPGDTPRGAGPQQSGAAADAAGAATGVNGKEPSLTSPPGSREEVGSLQTGEGKRLLRPASPGAEPPLLPDGGEVVQKLPPFADPDGGRSQALLVLDAMLQQIRQAEASWQTDRRGLEDELSFYRGCHAAQAAHVKSIMGAGREALDAVLESGHQAASALSAALSPIMKVAVELPEAPSNTELQTFFDQFRAATPPLQQSLEALSIKEGERQPSSAIMDPLEKDYRDRMQVLFGNLQSKRVAVFRQRSLSLQLTEGAPSPRQSIPPSPSPRYSQSPPILKSGSPPARLT